MLPPAARMARRVRHGFTSTFLRSLSPYGFAVRSKLVRSYDVDDWMAVYRRGLAHILERNRGGVALRENLTAILLHKMSSPSGARYVDLPSPAGIAIGAPWPAPHEHVVAAGHRRELRSADDRRELGFGYGPGLGLFGFDGIAHKYS